MHTLAAVTDSETLTTSGASSSTAVQVLDAIERELARLGPDYAQNVVRLAEAYAWLAGVKSPLD